MHNVMQRYFFWSIENWISEMQQLDRNFLCHEHFHVETIHQESNDERFMQLFWCIFLSHSSTFLLKFFYNVQFSPIARREVQSLNPITLFSSCKLKLNPESYLPFSIAVISALNFLCNFNANRDGMENKFVFKK